MLKEIAQRLTLCMILLAGSRGQTSPFTTSSTTTSSSEETKFENNVLNSILRVVDHKFDTLSARLTVMERAINGLQFYNIRQFRSVSSKIQNTHGVLERFGAQIGHTSAASRALKLAVNILSRDVSSMQESNSRMFSELEQSILYVNNNVEQRSQELKQKLDSHIGDREGDAESLLDEAKVIDKNSSIPDANCSKALSSMEERINVRFTELANHTDMVLESLSNVSLNRENKVICKCDQDKKSSFIDNEMLYHAIANMTSNVVQSVSFFRHTSSMLERIIENTDNVAFQQKKLRTDIVEIFSESAESSFSESSEKRAENSFSESFDVKVEEGGSSDSVAYQHIGRKKYILRGTVGKCNVSETVLRGIARFATNGSQLLELLTELAQMSTVSMTASIDELKIEVARLGELVNSDQSLPVAASTTGEVSLLKIINTTRATFHLTEAVASNTGWIPYIFHNVQFVETQLNKSMDITNLLLTEMRKLRNNLPASYGRMENLNSQHGAFNHIPRKENSKKTKLYIEDMTNKEILQFIYETNAKLKRIMPALTRLVAEPEPLITLVDGRKNNEGRVEIFHDGQWGTLCDRRLGHVEASTICRHLGFVGGISAGSAYFGVGSGSFWRLNTTCLRTSRCPAVKHQTTSTTCSHEDDFSVICDHMLQLVPIEESNDVNTGLIEIYHDGRWRPICSHGFSRNEAQVACKQLGYTSGWIRDGKDRSHSTSVGWMTNVSCRGTEMRLDACRYNHFGRRSCPGHRPAAVTCE